MWAGRVGPELASLQRFNAAKFAGYGCTLCAEWREGFSNVTHGLDKQSIFNIRLDEIREWHGPSIAFFAHCPRSRRAKVLRGLADEEFE